jgi:hypothetical protein
MAGMAENKKPDQSEKNKPAPAKPEVRRPKEIGGPKGPEPTRYGDWEVNGRVSDF